MGSMNAMAEALTEIAEIIREPYRRAVGDLRINRTTTNSDSENWVGMRILILNQIAGHLLGKHNNLNQEYARNSSKNGLCPLQQMRDLTNGKIKLHRNKAPKSIDRVIEIVGNASQVRILIYWILRRVREWDWHNDETGNSHNGGMKWFYFCHDADINEDYGGYSGDGTEDLAGTDRNRASADQNSERNKNTLDKDGGFNWAYREFDGNKDEKPDFSNIDIGLAEPGLRFLVHRQMAGRIIGKKGETLEYLRNQYSVNIDVLRSEGSNDAIVIISPKNKTAEDKDRSDEDFKIISREKVLNCLLEILSNTCVEMRKLEMTNGYDKALKLAANPSGVSCKFLVNRKTVGMIIGKGAKRIQEFQKTFGGNISCFKECLPGSNDRLCSITSTPESIFGFANCLMNIVQSNLKEEDNNLPPYRGKLAYFEHASIHYGGFNQSSGEKENGNYNNNV